MSARLPAERELGRVVARLRRDRARRDDLLEELRREGLSYRRLGELVGLSDVGVLEILRRRRAQAAAVEEFHGGPAAAKALRSP